ncbi:sugar transferase [Gordonia hongkongensis]|uniref:sugar transferase n=1 Tax=Gordonia hongkongensis TaxID=1701090 RepID=UPI001FF97D44|nr:sugar transferase [Gordonia hongkongensis]UPG69215.1 sugar transferase [Gordonia hongkongensis]
MTTADESPPGRHDPVFRRPMAVRRRQSRSRSWVPRYRTWLRRADVLVVVGSVGMAQQLRFGSGGSLDSAAGVRIPWIVASAVLVVVWLTALFAFQSYDRRIFGSGAQEYSRVATACFTVFGTLAIIDLLFRINIARGYLAIALPVGTIGLLVSRNVFRRMLARARVAGRHRESVLIVGSDESVRPTIRRLSAAAPLGYEVVGACLPSGMRSGSGEIAVEGAVVPVLGDFDDVAVAVGACGATTVAVTSADALGHQAMQDMSWNLHGLDVDMVLAPGVADVTGPRMMVRPVAGLPLLHIDHPRYEAASRLRKAALDRCGAALLILLLAPLLVVVAVAVVVDTGLPVFYRAERVGVGNRTFRMWKFRSMVTGADRMRADLHDQDEGAGLLFKMRDDPRVTRVGNVIRAYSLDELPQLFNVLTGDMSLVGPRPPLPEEVEKYDGRVARRMLVKPGMTGLWQVSGRSDLSWEEAVRLDLSYVENWSIMQDLTILWKTARAVIAKDGAY